ncbi:unnamed protein product [Hyaloperonospora brassicae]|uniref:Ribosomal protein L22 n=1 Tax=Hyaloperonospora brassicae TaxID=162125 RepID=A0AAV0UTQ2_HYABA|nr:unnamed protein product [Hyaloperonospora brassicae]
MLTLLRAQMGALSLRPAARNVVVIRAALSTAAEGAKTPPGDALDADTAAFLSSTSSIASEPRTVKTVKRAIRASPRKLTYLAQQLRGLSATEALLQMKFSPKRKAEIFQKTVQNAINLADIKYQIEPENLMVAECFVNKGAYLKRMRIMGRGRSGVMHHPYTHLTVVLREFDASKKPLSRHLAKKLARETAAKAKALETSGPV